jgi:hypothetical protein
MEVENALAYYDMATITAAKSFIMQTSGSTLSSSITLSFTKIWRHDSDLNDIKYNDIQYNDIQYDDIQYNDIQYNGIQYNDSQCNSNTHF